MLNFFAAIDDAAVAFPVPGDAVITAIFLRFIDTGHFNSWLTTLLFKNSMS